MAETVSHVPEPGTKPAEPKGSKDANDILVNEDDERQAQQRFDETGEPDRDALGNQAGAS